MWSTGQVRKGVKRNRKKKNTGQSQSGHREVCSFRFGCYRWGRKGAGAASVVLSYLRVDLKDRALCREKRRESCEPRLDGLA